MFDRGSYRFGCVGQLGEKCLTRRQSQRRDLSRVVLAHASRQLPSWLIFDVSQKMTFTITPLTGATAGAESDKHSVPLGEALFCEMRCFFDVLPPLDVLNA